MTPLWVVDTNVFVSAALTSGGVCDQVVQYAVAGRFCIAWDNILLAEYRDVLLRPRFGLSQAAVKRLLCSLAPRGFRRGARLSLKVPDADDLPFLAVACATDDRTIVTGNPGHFPKAAMRPLGVVVLTPRQALANLDLMEA